MDYTIGVLLFGNHPDLAKRCLGSICRHAREALPGGLRIGMNACGIATQDYVRGLIHQGLVLDRNIYRSEENIHKYPMMRRMFYEPSIQTNFTMWFDDDSFIRSDADRQETGRPASFLAQVSEVMDNRMAPAPGLIGAPYTIRLSESQKAWIRDQWWYAGIELRNVAKFITGGWWVARTVMLRRFNYPWPTLDHRGGDVMLGVMCEQQNVSMKSCRRLVAINADAEGNESRAARRGFDQPPIGTGYRRPVRSGKRLIDVLPL